MPDSLSRAFSYTITETQDVMTAKVAHISHPILRAPLWNQSGRENLNWVLIFVPASRSTDDTHSTQELFLLNKDRPTALLVYRWLDTTCQIHSCSPHSLITDISSGYEIWSAELQSLGLHYDYKRTRINCF